MIKTALAAMGFSWIKAAIIGGAALAAVTAFAVYRQSLINTGWDRALVAVRKQDTTAKEAASRVQGTVDRCVERGDAWFWDVVTQDCIKEAAE